MQSARGWLHNAVGGLPSRFWYLWAGTLINRLGGFVLIFLAIYLTRVRNFSELQSGFVIGLWGVGGAAGTMLGGTLTDRWGRRPTLLTAQLGAAAMMIALPGSPGEFHPRAPTDPDVNLSIYPARAVQVSGRI